MKLDDVVWKPMTKQIKDLTGQRFGMLTVVKYVGMRRRNAHWLCKCDCGGETVTATSTLLQGNIKSCGCLHTKQASELCVKRNTTHGSSKEPLYFVWKTMRQRCLNPKQHDYKWYGAKGIKICKEWDDYTVFRECSMSNGYKKGLTIDRIDVDKDYGPDNCRWITIQEQQRNKKSYGNRWLGRPCMYNSDCTWKGIEICKTCKYRKQRRELYKQKSWRELINDQKQRSMRITTCESG